VPADRTRGCCGTIGVYSFFVEWMALPGTQVVCPWNHRLRQSSICLNNYSRANCYGKIGLSFGSNESNVEMKVASTVCWGNSIVRDCCLPLFCFFVIERVLSSFKTQAAIRADIGTLGSCQRDETYRFWQIISTLL